MSPARGGCERALLALLSAVAVLPVIAVGFGSRDGRIVFMDYREPKLLAIQLTAWPLVLLALWCRPGALQRVARALPHDAVSALLAGLVALLALSASWAPVRLNSAYELVQWLPLVLLYAVVVDWARNEPTVRLHLVRSLVAAIALATVVGLLQGWQPIPWLAPIDPQLGVENPSLMGYKNPMAQALLAQIFLLAFLVVRRPEPAAGTVRAWHRLLPAALLVTELLYLVSLQSRAVYAALLVTGVPLLVTLLVRALGQRRLAVAAGGVLLAVGIIVAGFATLPAARARMATLRTTLASGADILGEDRPTYAANTLVMVRDHPFGVGVGNWQVMYPVYRSQGRDVAFSEQMQVRRAHSDPVQVLGEAGWQGLGLWLGLLVAAVLGSWRSAAQRDDDLALFTGFQLAAVAVAGTFDYVLDLPYGKLQVVLLLALAATSRRLPASTGGQRRSRRGLAAVVLAALLSTAYVGAVSTRTRTAAWIGESYGRLVAAGPPVQPLTASQQHELARLDTLGDRFEHQLGTDKTLHKDWLMLAHVAHLGGDDERAAQLAARSLALQPYYPNAFRFLGMLYEDRDPALAARYLATYDYILHRATDGFDIAYPPLPGDE